MRRPIRRIVEGTRPAATIAAAGFISLLRSIGPVRGAVRRSTLALLPTLAAIAGERHTKGARGAQIDGRSVEFLMIRQPVFTGCPMQCEPSFRSSGMAPPCMPVGCKAGAPCSPGRISSGGSSLALWFHYRQSAPVSPKVRPVVVAPALVRQWARLSATAQTAPS